MTEEDRFPFLVEFTFLQFRNYFRAIRIVYQSITRPPRLYVKRLRPKGHINKNRLPFCTKTDSDSRRYRPNKVKYEGYIIRIPFNAGPTSLYIPRRDMRMNAYDLIDIRTLRGIEYHQWNHEPLGGWPCYSCVTGNRDNI